VFHCAPPPLSFFKARFVFQGKIQQGRTDSVRPSNDQDWLLKIKLFRVCSMGTRLIRVLLRARLQRAFSFRRHLWQEVALQQPKVAAQLPAGGDVSYTCPCVSMALFARCATAADGSPRSSKPPRGTACGWLERLPLLNVEDYFIRHYGQVLTSPKGRTMSKASR